MSLAPGTRLGPYEVLAPLGAGGMGEVYRARDTRLDRTVAVKILPQHLAGDERLRQRFEQEARAISKLNHPHICTLHDVGQQGSVHYLVMECLEGESLTARIARGPLPLAELLRAGMQIAEALDVAHRHGVVHRDLKPGNVMLTKTGVKLLDFGLAKAVPSRAVDLSAAPTADQPITAEGAILGTVQYMAPEQLEGKEADPRTDIFALGAVLYEMATGKHAFTGKTQASLMAAILEHEPPPLTALQPLTPPMLEHVVRTCLAKDPDERWQSARDVGRQLKWVAEGGSQVGLPAPVVTRRKHRELAAWGTAAALLVTSIVLGIGFVLRAPKEPQAIRATILPPEGWQLAAWGAASISADGRQIAFVASDGKGKSLLWARPVDSLAARQLPGTESARFPFWSPDGRYLGFFADGKLKKIDVAGGPAVTLCDAPTGRGGTWNGDGVIVFAPERLGALFRVPAAGGTPAPVTNPASQEWTHRLPEFLPDGQHFLFIAGKDILGAAVLESRIEIGSLLAAGTQTLLSADSKAVYSSGHLLFVRESSLMAQRFDPGRLTTEGEPFPVAEEVQSDNYGWFWFVAAPNGTLVYRSTAAVHGQLTWHDRSGKALGTLGEPADYRNPRISPDGSRVAVSVFTTERRQDESDIWLLDATRNVPTRFTFGPQAERVTVWSPDGKFLVFSRDRAGLLRKAASGVGEEEMLAASDSIAATDWSPDGNHVLYRTITDAKKGTDIWILPMTGDRKPVPFVNTPSSETAAVFSPDGRWVAYVSNESGRDEVYVAPFPKATGKWQVSGAGGSVPRWRADGKEIFFLGPDGRILATEVSMQGSSFRAGKTSELFQVRLAGGAFPYDVARDGRFLMVVAATQEDKPAPITLVVNWPAAVKK